MPEVLHTLTKAGGVRLVPKAGLVQFTFPSGWKGNLPITLTLTDPDINTTSIIRVEYTPQNNPSNKEALDDREFDNPTGQTVSVGDGTAQIRFYSPKAPVVGIKTFTYYIFEP